MGLCTLGYYNQDNLRQLQNFIADHYSDILLAFDVKINWNATALRKSNIIFTRTA